MNAPDSLSPPPVLSGLSAAVLRTLAYFAIFHHPLTAAEVFEGCDHPAATLPQVADELAELVRQGCVRQEGTYYALDAASSAAAREASGARCQQLLARAYRYSRLIARFPFVRGVCISGSLSKGRADAGADIDYFIVTEPGRLWVCRSLLTLFKKTALLNSHRYFCLNYFVDTDHLTIPDQNVYTATEIAFLLPTYDYATYAAFLQANEWVGAYYPHKPPLPARHVFERGDTRLKAWAERLLGGRLGDALENLCLRLTRAYRRRRFAHLAPADFRHALRTTRGVATHHPHSFQARVLQAYAQKRAELRRHLGFDLI